MPPTSLDASAGVETEGSTGTPQLPWSSIPKFSPGVTNVQEYTQKLKFLAAMWPVDYLDQLAPRAALLVEGTAFRKVARLDASKLKVKSQAGVAALVEAIGGSWGATELEERYEYFEKALYGTVQRHDESHDSFLARMENNFIELLSRNTKLEEVQAYVLLRQSTLPAEDKKRILLEHEGELKYAPVVKSFRLLGSKFFNEFQGGRSQVKNRVYDVNFTESAEGDVASTHISESSMTDRAYFTSVDDTELELDSEYLDVLISQEDPDALAVANFEQEFEDFLQDIPEMHEAMVTYMEARSKLLEKRKGRGFWPVKGKGGFKKGRGKGGKSKKDRDQLLARISRSRCRKCGQVGHWKAECPNPPADSSAASANVAEVFGVTVPDDLINNDDDEVHSDSESATPVSCCQFNDFSHHFVHSDPSNVSPSLNSAEAFVVQALKQDNIKQDLRNRLIKLKESVCHRGQVHPFCAPVPRYEIRSNASPSQAFCFVPELPHVEAYHVSALERPCSAILDTGASRCIIGENVWNQLQEHLSPDVRNQVKIKPSNVKFRFGNNQFLTSHFRTQIPLRACFEEPKRLWLSLEVVPGNTPFLFSKRAFKQLGGVLDTVNDTCFLKRLNRYVDLSLSKTDLYLIDLTQLCEEPTNRSKVSNNVFVHDGFVTESRGSDSSNRGHERFPSSFPHSFVHCSKETIGSSHAQNSNCDSKFSIDRDPDPASSLIPNKHAESNDGDIEGRCRVHDSPDDDAPPDFDFPVGGFKQLRDAGRLRRGQSRNEANVGEHGPRAAKPPKHFAGIDGEPTGPSKSSSSSRSWVDKWKQSDTSSWRNRCKSWPSNPTSSSSTKCQSTGFGYATIGTSCKSSWNCDQFHVDSGRGGGTHRGENQCDDRASLHGSSSSHNDGIQTFVNHRAGTESHHLGQKAQGEDMAGSLPNRSGLLPLVSSPLWKSTSRPTRVCPLLPDANRSRSSSQWPVMKTSSNDVNQLSDVVFEQEVNQVRELISEPVKPDKLSSAANLSVSNAESIMEEVYSSAKSPRLSSSVFLLEVYAGKNSPLTDLAQKMNLRAIRFTRDDGDLSTPWGRKKLWEWIDKFQPEHIWVAPECGPWGGWSRLNQSKSVDLHDAISREQEKQLIHVRLCSQLCNFQIQNHRQFHLEQPLGSRMVFLPEFQPIFRQTLHAKFDMCVLGLKLPKTNRFLKKRSQVFSTHETLVIQLDNCQCSNAHEHHHIEGSVTVDQQRMPLTRFCATYCSGFVRFVLKALCIENALVNEDEPPQKKTRFSNSPAKRIRLNPIDEKDPEPIEGDTRGSESPDVKAQSSDPNQVNMELKNPISDPAGSSAAVSSEPSSTSERWKEAFRMAHVIAPRVGNILVDDSSLLTGLVQSCISDMTVQKVFVCRGTERLQLPVAIANSIDCSLRHTACLHRTSGKVHIFDTEDWTQLKRLQRIRNSIPSKLTITSFGTAYQPNIQKNVPKTDHISQLVPSETSGQPSKFDVDTAKSQTVSQQPEICEGWAPPPTPIHGPLFRNLSEPEKSDIVKLHKNLGHPDPNVLADHLKIQGAPDHIVAGAREYVCDACVESTSRRHQRPAKLHDPVDFNHTLGIDGFYWSGKQGFQVHVLHCIDEASLFHLGRRTMNRNPDHVNQIWQEFWTSWAGSPHTVYVDPAGEFRSQTWKSSLQGLNVNLEMTTEAWQRGRIERHGAIIKQMLDRFDQDHTIVSTEHLDQVLLACFMAKNSLMRHHGYSPEQIVLGKSTKLPASLSSDESSIAHGLAIGDSPESEYFRNTLDLRSKARIAFLKADNDHAIRRALLRKSCPIRGPYEKGQLVMYWMKAPKASRLGPGRWHGPAKVICQESPSAVWISHGDRLFKCAPESLRPASMREWNQAGPLRVPFELTEGPRVENLGLEVNSPEYAPTTPSGEFDQAVLPEGTPLMTPQSSLQPETEAIPAVDVPVSDTPLDTPVIEPHSNTDVELPESLDLDAEDSFHSATSEEQILLCSPLDSQDCDSLLDCSVFQPGEPECRILLAEDGLPFHEQPKTCQVDECFSLQIELSENDVHKWCQSEKPEALVHVASVAKRSRSEVQVKSLSLEDRFLFDKAKDAELNCWLQTSALKPILRKHLNPDQILRSRWVLTWKPLEDAPSEGPHRKAKARLVVLGFQDPQLTEVVRDAPTLTREGRHTVLQAIASYQWVLSSFDIKTAFLRGKADSKNPLAMEPPIELRKKLALPEDQVCALVGNAYGRVDAPLLFYKELTKQLQKLNFRTHPLEPCVFLLESLQNHRRIIHGILGTHVDDGVCGGDEYFHQQLEKLKIVLPFGAFKQRKFTFTGIVLEQLPDFSIACSQEDYVRQIPAIDIGRSRRMQPDSQITESELSKLRGLVGSLQYAVTHSRPDIASKLGEVQTQISRATVNTLILANKVLRECQEQSQVKICFRHIPVKEVTHISFGDASFASPKQLSSFQGSIVFATNSKMNCNEQAPVSPLTWSSKKIARVVRSTLSAEAFSMSRSVDKLGWMRLLWGVVTRDDFDWRDPPKSFRLLPQATIVTDCKSLFDLVTRCAMPTCEEYRTTLEVLLIKERCSEHCNFRWIPTALQLADPLTKPMDASLLRVVLSSGVFQLFDEEAALQQNAHRKEAVSWLKAKGLPSGGSHQT